MGTLRQHVESSLPSPDGSFVLPWWRPQVEEEDEVRCMHCGTWTDDYHDSGLWDLPFSEFAKVHEEMMKDELYEYPAGDLSSILSGEISERKTCLHICPKCGWWVAEDRAVLPSKKSQIWVVQLSSMSVLQELDLADINVPIQEVRRYLMRRFDSRSVMHPRLFELTVASVFRDHGYNAVATAYSNDGGIDIVLRSKSCRPVGVQVKRKKGVVEVEQIRAFLGALTLGGYSRGVFVSTSRFSKGAIHAAKKCASNHIPIELVDADRFFDMLGWAQLSGSPGPEDCGIKKSRPLQFHYDAHYYLNSL